MGVKKSAVAMTAWPPLIRTAAASSPLSRPTSRFSSSNPGRPPRSSSSSLAGTLHAQPPPAANWVSLTIGPPGQSRALPFLQGLGLGTGGVPRLVTGAVFKTVVAEQLGQAGSIPVRLRQNSGGASEPRKVRVNDPRRSLPSVDRVLAEPPLVRAIEALGRNFVTNRVRAALEESRARAAAPSSALHDASAASLAAAVAGALPSAPTSLREVINATGIVVHTNLGRAPLSEAARAALVQAAGATDVELDLATGRRSPRGQAAIDALAAAAGAGAHVVNNGAAAIVLACHVLAPAGNIVLSRGEMVEIGDGFRIPELIAATGVEIREVGTTNRTHLRDYTNAIDARTGFVLKVHPSNFLVEGFAGGVGIDALAREAGVARLAGRGSGLLRPHPLRPDEPDARTALREGASLVIASGDKLLGGPQAGLLLGEPELIHRLRRHPLARALRVDKLTLAALEATLLGPPPPVVAALARTREELRGRARRIAEATGGRVVDTEAAVGGGGGPGVSLPSAAVALPEKHAAALRAQRPAVMGRVRDGQVLLDLIAVDPREDAALISALHLVLAEGGA